MASATRILPGTGLTLELEAAEARELLDLIRVQPISYVGLRRIAEALDPLVEEDPE